MSNVIATSRDQGMPFEPQFLHLFIVMAESLLKSTSMSQPDRPRLQLFVLAT